MKRIFLIAATFLLVSVIVIPAVSLAQDSPLRCCKLNREVKFEGVTYNKNDRAGSGGVGTCTLTGGEYKETKSWTLVCLLSTIIVVTDWIFAFAIGLVSLLVIFGAYTITTAAGDPTKMKSGRNYIMYALLGFVLALFSKAIPDLVTALMGV